MHFFFLYCGLRFQSGVDRSGVAERERCRIKVNDFGTLVHNVYGWSERCDLVFSFFLCGLVDTSFVEELIEQWFD